VSLTLRLALKESSSTLGFVELRQSHLGLISLTMERRARAACRQC